MHWPADRERVMLGVIALDAIAPENLIFEHIPRVQGIESSEELETRAHLGPEAERGAAAGSGGVRPRPLSVVCVFPPARMECACEMRSYLCFPASHRGSVRVAVLLLCCKEERESFGLRFTPDVRVS